MKEDYIFATSLADEVAAFKLLRSGKPQVLLSPGWMEVTVIRDQLVDELKKKRKYFHSEGGSVFSDYKNLRNTNLPEKTTVEKYIPRFHDDMSAEEILTTAENIVVEWKASSGIESKG